jgi:hypothetical protein
MAFLTPAQLAKAQAEAEGFQNGPQPALNPANIYTQDMAGNPITPSTGLTPYYPSSETPNLQLSTRDMASELANNFCIIDSLLVGYAPGANVPVISQKLQVLNATTVQSLSLTLPSTQLVQVSLYASSAGTGGAGHVVVITINYTCELGPETITVSMPLDSRNIIMETYPLLCLSGTTVTLITAYAGGATNDPYNIDVRLVQMP